MASKGRKIFIFVLALLFGCFFVKPLFAEHLPVKIFTSADGLGSSFVDYLMRDARGFMWFCTRDGLSRFDGAHFITYQIGNDTAAPGIESLYQTRDGIYWVTTTGGSYRFDLNEISKPNAAKPQINAEFVTPRRGSFFEDSAGNLYFMSGELSRVLKKDGKYVLETVELNLPPRDDNNLVIAEMDETNDGSLWLNSSWGLIRRLPDSRIVYYPIDSSFTGGNASMRVDKTGRIWTSTENRLLVIKPEALDSFAGSGGITIKSLEPSEIINLNPKERFSLPKTGGEIFQFSSTTINNFVENSYAKRIFQTSDGDVWITAEDKLMQFSNGVFQLHTRSEGLPNVMARMAEDSAGNLWIGGHAGLARLDRHGLVTYGTGDGANSSRFFAISEDASGTIYVVGRDFYLNRFDGEKFEAVKPSIEPDSQFLWTSRFGMRAKNGDWWILTSKKLYYFASVANFSDLDKRKPTKTFSSADGLKADGMFQIFEDPEGSIWISTRGRSASGNSVARLKKGEDKFYTFTEAEGLPEGKSASSYITDTTGNLWLCFYDGGIARFDGERFEFFDEKNNLPGGVLTDLHIDAKGRLWIASTIGGLIRLDDTSSKIPVFTSFTTADGLTSNNVRTITEDRLGRIYIGTASGVDRITPDTGRVQQYSVNDGLAADFIVDSHCDRNGDVWFATNDGLSRLVPLPDEKFSVPQIFLGGLRIAGVEQPISQLGNTVLEKGELAHTDNNFQIDFFGLDFRAGETLRYQYKLEGADNDWSAPTELRSVTFANLQPGTYRFLVRAVNSDGTASENPAVVSFKILPPIWARWWFIALCALVAIAIFITLERYRAARLREIKTAFGSLTISENRFRNLVEQSPFGIIVMTPDGKIRTVNDAYVKMWGEGATKEEILNWDIRNDEQMIENGVVEGLGRVFGGEFVKFEPVLYDMRKNPFGMRLAPETQTIWIDAVAYPIKDEDGNLREVIAVLENITARKNAEEKLERSRRERLIELEQVRSRIATDLHDDIGASLTQIAVLSEVAQAQNKGKAFASAEPLAKISNVSNELVEAMSDIVWAINPSKDHLSDLTQRMRRFASDILSAKGIAFQFHASGADSGIVINTNLRREVFLIFKETINNIVKHSDAKHVAINLKIADGNLNLKIADDGSGFDRERTFENSLSSFELGGNGINSMQKRASEMNGQLEIVSAIGKGTTVDLTLPLEQIIENRNGNE